MLGALSDTDAVTEALILPERRGSTVSWAWTRFAETIPVARFVGVAALSMAACTVIAGMFGFLLPGVVPIVLFWLVLIILLAVGSWLTLTPHSDELNIAELVLGPVIWTAMMFTWDDNGHVITPIALVYAGVLAAAFYSWQVLTLVLALCVGASLVYVVRWSELSFVGVRGISALAVLALFSVGVHLLRRRVRQVQDTLRSQSSIDALTGLPNRRHVSSMAAGLLASAHRQEREVYALVLDIDRLAVINQQAGSDVGDEVLAAFAASVRAALRPEDMLIRVGGEELLAAGVVRSQFEAVRIAERLRLQVRRSEVPVMVTCSIGVATARPGSGVDPVEWLWNLTAIAEESLAAAKASGRDRVTPARQSGDVLGDALELVTARAATVSSRVVAEPVPVKPVVWTSPTRIARITGALALAGSLLIALTLRQPPMLSSPEALIMSGAACAYVLSAGWLVVRPTQFRLTLPLTVFAADVIWATSALLGAESDGYISSLSGLIMCGFAAWLFSRRVFVSQLVITFPLMFVVVRGAGLGILESILVALLHASTLVAAAVAFYLLRLHSEHLIAQSAASATTDPTTGLANRRLLTQRAPGLVAEAARQQVAVSIVLVDILDFWQINEKHGYAGGDRVLADTGRALYRSSRAEDTLLRLGGDNFLIVCVGDPEEARRVADRAATAMAGVTAFGAPLASRVAMASGWPQRGEEAVPWLMQLIEQVDEDMRAERAAAAQLTASGI